MELTKERWVVIAGGTGLFILFILYFIFYQPMLSKLGAKKKQCQIIESQLIESKKDIALFREMPAVKNLISEEAASLAVEELTHLGKSKGLNFQSISPKPVTVSNDSQYKILPVEMVVTSSYSQLGEFLGALDDLEKTLLTVSQFKITPEIDNPSKLKTELVLNLYLTNHA